MPNVVTMLRNAGTDVNADSANTVIAMLAVMRANAVLVLIVTCWANIAPNSREVLK